MKIYTDGSFSVKTLGCGFAFIVIEDDTVTHKDYGNIGYRKAGAVCAEHEAFMRALKWLTIKPNKRYWGTEITIYTDLLTNVRMHDGKVGGHRTEVTRLALESYERAMRSIRNRGITVNVEYVKSHVGEVGNELADVYARLGSKLPVCGSMVYRKYGLTEPEMPVLIHNRLYRWLSMIKGWFQPFNPPHMTHSKKERVLGYKI